MKVKKLHPDAKIPTRAYPGDLGFDLYALENTTLPAVNESGGLPVTLVRTGVAVEFPRGWGAFIKDRSSKAVKKRIHTVAGVIDNGYRGEIKVAVVNLSGRVVTIKKGERFAQLVPVSLYDGVAVEVEELSDTERGTGGFGSSDKGGVSDEYCC